MEEGGGDCGDQVERAGVELDIETYAVTNRYLKFMCFDAMQIRSHAQKYFLKALKEDRSFELPPAKIRQVFSRPIRSLAMSGRDLTTASPCEMLCCTPLSH